MSNRQSEIDELFEKAAGVVREKRAAYLDEACDGKPSEIRLAVEKLLKADEQIADEDTSFLDNCPGNVSAWAPAAPDHQRLIGTTIGGYKIEEVIGSGGFGVVYLGRRIDEFEQKVAIKLSHLEHKSQDPLLRRFEFERQVLSDLQHPNIARLLDGGCTDDGRPYFVMEYVDGMPINKHCHANQLDVGERLKLFQQVCDAVAHAQQFSIIHRDLKPANILIDAYGSPKLLDFGIAKYLDERMRDADVAMTATGQVVMTPGYASPEQVNDAPLQMASDVYSLGVILYELLTGKQPYVLTGHSPYEVARIINEEIPRKPSSVIVEVDTRAAASSEPADSIQMGEMDGRAIKNVLAGDLDNIVGKALSKDPEERYPTADALSGDIQRYFDGMPITATRSSSVYVLSKFVRRHRFAVAISGIAILLAIVGAVNALIAWNQVSKLAVSLNENLYITDIGLASRDFEEGNFVNMENRLLAHIPADEGRDNRGSCWYLMADLLKKHRQSLQEFKFERSENTRRIHFDRTNKLYCLGLNTRSLVEFDIETKKTATVLQLSEPEDLSEPKDGVVYFAERKLAAIIRHTKDPTEIEVRDFYSSEIRHTIVCKRKQNRVQISNYGKHLVGFGEKGALTIWSTDTGEVLFDDPEAGMPLNTVTNLSPDGRYFVVALPAENVPSAPVGKLKILDLVNGTNVVEQPPTASYPVFSLDSKHLLIAGRDLHVWTMTPDGISKSIFAEGVVEHCKVPRFSPSGKYLAFITRGTGRTFDRIEVWDWATRQKIASHDAKEAMQELSFFDSEDRLLIHMDRLAIKRGRFHIWNFSSPSDRQPVSLRGNWVKAFAVDHTKSIVASGGPEQPLTIWEPFTNRRQQLGEMRETTGFTGFGVSANGRYAAYGDWKAHIEVWDLESGKKAHDLDDRSKFTPSGKPIPVISVAFSPDSKLLVSGGLGYLSGWDMATGDRVWHIQTPEEFPNGQPARHRVAYVYDAFFDSKGTLYTATSMFGSGPASLCTWDLSGNQPELTTRLHLDGQVTTMAHSPNEELLAVANGSNINLYNMSNLNEEPKQLAGHVPLVLSLTFFDEHTLFSSDFSAEVVAWDVATGREVIRLKDKAQKVTVLRGPAGKVGMLFSRVLGGKQAILNIDWLDFEEIDDYWRSKKVESKAQR